MPVIAILASLLLVTSTAAAQSPGHIVGTEWLAARLDDPRVIILHVEHHRESRTRIPGARAVDYMQVIARQGALSTELPPVEHLREVFERAGVSDSSFVVAYGDEPPMVARVLFTLAWLGHDRFAMLDGGLAAWQAERRPVSRERRPVAPGRLTVRLRPELVATADWITSRLDRPGTAFIDTRTDGEYLGTGNRSGMPSLGHLAGAHQLQWEQLFKGDRPWRLHERGVLERLLGERARPGDTVVTYCWVGYRASMTWLVARHLGYDARLYDGSYQDWSQRGLPVRGGARP